jgi:LuxR family transcriptional regulator, maltose regulon positive regulatory protein
LRAPSPRAEQLNRPGLLKILEDVYGRRLTLVSAPAGYGKTTLLSQWYRAQKPSSPFAWISLDEQDNDSVRLWRHIVEAIRQAAPEKSFGADVLAAIGSVGQSGVEAVLPKLVNELAELGGQTVVVLDDYQVLTEERCHELVDYFLRHLPENAHLCLASRSDPPLPLGRLRARGEMNEVRAEQLAFSEEEAASLLNEKMGLRVGPDDLRVLMQRTEGWPAGLYLAALSLQNKVDGHAYIKSFGGKDRYVVDLLGEEVMAKLSEEEREFLLKTSILRRLTGSLCDAVVGRKNSSKLLRELSRRNLFVAPLDERDEWYRCHQLFSEFLLYELKSSRPELVPVLHQRASAWLEGEGYFDSAVRQAMAAEDHERVGLLVARHWYGYVLSGQMRTVQGWFEALPEGSTRYDGALLLVRAWFCALSGRGEEVERLLMLAEGLPNEGPLPDGTASVEAGLAVIRGVFGLGGIKSTLEAARQAVALEPELTSPRAALIRFGLGSSSYLSGETSQARQQFEEALEIMGYGQPLLRMVCLSFLSIVAADEGQLEEADLLAREARASVERFGLMGVPQSSWAAIALGNVLAERGDLIGARGELEAGLSARTELPGLSLWPTLIGLLALARVQLARGDRDGARGLLDEARTILEPFGDDAGIFPALLERQERELRKNRQRDGSLNGELTGRELAVLRLLDGELSTRQIGDSLYVAPSTVRTQVKSIYRKLGASSRGEAVEEARARGLL